MPLESPRKTVRKAFSASFRAAARTRVLRSRAAIQAENHGSEPDERNILGQMHSDPQYIDIWARKFQAVAAVVISLPGDYKAKWQYVEHHLPCEPRQSLWAPAKPSRLSWRPRCRCLEHRPIQRRRGASPLSSLPPDIDRRRFRRVRWFFFRAFVKIFWHDFVLDRPLLRLLRSDPVSRWVSLALRYRILAVEMGGVLIKLGQYLSTRVDILPREVTGALSGLQDEVPAAEWPQVAAQIEDDFQRPLADIFSHFEPVPIGAASLAQVHTAQLPDGQSVVVKVLRPGIEILVETDLEAIARAVQWLKAWRFVRRRIDLDWVVEEFSSTTRRELDLLAEGRNVEHFTELFDDDDDDEVYLPKVYWPYSARRTLTEENVAYLKVSDLDALEAHGIAPSAVARQLYRTYMRQIFVHHWVHADPHPGNIFVKPIADGDEGGGQFQVVFVDFGMVAEIPPRLRAALRRFIIGLGSRDAVEVVQAFRDGGYLLPGADLVQIEEAVEAIFDRFWGVEIGRLNDLVLSEAAPLWKEFGQLLLETPIQLQVDLMFTGRAIELLSGLSTNLDESFNPWLEVVPFAEALAGEVTGRGGWQAKAMELGEEVLQLTKLPGNIARVASLARRGRLTLRFAPAPESRRQLQRLEQGIDNLAWSVMSGAALLGSAWLYGDAPWLAATVAAVAVLTFLLSRWR